MKERLETEQNVLLCTDNHVIMAGRLGFLCQGIGTSELCYHCNRQDDIET